ncbi:MAG TPA: SdpI family protein [Thermoanaerobaculia bacterium]|nr:SdpI family protein [Thermoanaerobaculia bacterium]
MKLQRGESLSLILVVAAFLLSAVLYSRLPERLPTHWNARGEIDGYMSKPIGAFFGPGLMAFVFLIFLALPSISPKGFRFEGFRAVWGVLQAAILGVLFFMHTLALLAAMGKPVDMRRGAAAAVGLLLVVLGNFLGKVTRNFFVGIRTPWTLASEEVWFKTHRLGGKLFVLAGLATFVLGLAGARPIAIGVVIGAAALISVVASYVFYRRIEGFKAEADSR